MTQPIRAMEGRRPRSAHAKLFGTGELYRRTRCCVIVAHPADEIVGAGCLISKLADVTILHITDGVPRDNEDAQAAGFKRRSEFAQASKEECAAALAIANVPSERIVDFDVIGQQAPRFLTDLTKRITTFLQQSSADIVVTHPYEGGHPDHDATAFATHAAMRLMKRNGLKPPVLFEMALHPSDDGKAKVPEFLPGFARESTTLLLDDQAQELKRRMFACFETQRDALQASLVGPERFREPSGYDFSNPPQRGKLHYEKFDWGITGREWQSLACEALADLFPTNNEISKQASFN